MIFKFIIQFTLLLFQSVFPAKLSAGLPRRHHVVVYQSVNTPQNHVTLQEKLSLQVSEVGATAWFDEELIRIIATHPRSSEGCGSLPAGVPPTFRLVLFLV